MTEPTPGEVENYLRLLSETPTRIASISNGLENTQLRFKPEKDTWSANDILAHLRSCADVWGDTIAAMLTQDNPTLPHIHPRTWIKKTDYRKLDFHQSFKSFAEQRTALLSTLSNIALDYWSRSSVIKGRKHTVFSQARRMALHESQHCDQIEALLG